jgi:predicted esterase
VLSFAVAASTLAVAAPATHRAPQPTSGVARLATIDDHGHATTFPLYWAAPKGPARALVIVFHGHGHNGEQYPAQLATLARDDNVAAVAVATEELTPGKASYRGPFDSVDEEARDAAAAIGWARARFHTGARTFLLGVSMGGSGLAYFIDAATRTAAGDRDAQWVQSFHPLPLAGMVDAEGIASLPETWAEATGFDKTTAAEIENETGGTPGSALAAYLSRSLALLPTASWQATRMPRVAVVHDVDDGLVPYNQTYEARAAALAAGISVESYDVVFKDRCSQRDQTTGTATITGEVPGFPTDQSEQQLCLAGHASENDPQTPVMQAAFVALHELVYGGGTPTTVVNPTRPTS